MARAADVGKTEADPRPKLRFIDRITEVRPDGEFAQPETAARPLWPGCPLNEHRGYVMLIKKHDSSDIVELEDGSLWRIWPGDIALTLNWLPTTDLLVSEIGDEFCSHALVDQTDDSRVRVIEASENWPVEHVRRSMKEG